MTQQPKSERPGQAFVNRAIPGEGNRGMDAGLRWYLTGTALLLIPGGVQMVLFPWLVTVVLHETPTRVGLAQMASQLPMLLLILWGGWLGDRVDQRRLLIGLSCAMAVPPILMAWVFQAGYFNYALLITWALIGGTFAAFVQPARDALLNRVAGRDIQRIVILTVGVQFGVQIFGFALGYNADVLGPPVLLIIMSILMISAALATSRIPPLPPRAPSTHQQPLQAIAEGIKLVWHDRALAPAIGQTFSVGIFFAGTYVVLLPLMVRDLYSGGSAEIATTFAANMLGTVCVTFILMRLGRTARPGRVLLIAAAVSASVLSLLMLNLPKPLFYFVVFLWGCCGGIGMTMSRTIVQEAATESHRARIMSVYSLGLMGGMPIGSFTLGVVTDWVGVRNAVWVPVIGMLIILLYLRLRTQLWYVASAVKNEIEEKDPS